MIIDLGSQDSVKRMLSSISAKKGRVSESTRTTYLLYIRRFCDFCGMTPDELFSERKQDNKSDDMYIRRRHEDKLKEFINYFREEGYSSNTIATATGAIKSLYTHNYYPMMGVNIPSGQPVREYKVPTKEELIEVIDLANMPWHGAFMTLTKDCGISLQDMLELKLDDRSQVYGSIKQQLKKGQIPIHINIVRKKTGFKYHTFLGEDSFEVLNNDTIFPDMVSHNKRLFPYTDSTIQDAMKGLGNKLGWTSFCPYSLRKWFRTQLSLSDMNEALIESMMGHSLGKVKEAYLVPPPQKLIEIYEKHYPALKL